MTGRLAGTVPGAGFGWSFTLLLGEKKKKETLKSNTPKLKVGTFYTLRATPQHKWRDIKR